MHYLEKLGRNVEALNNCPEEIKKEVMLNIDYVRIIVNSFEKLDPEEIEKYKVKINEILDKDYEKMGYSLEEYEQSR